MLQNNSGCALFEQTDLSYGDAKLCDEAVSMCREGSKRSVEAITRNTPVQLQHKLRYKTCE